MRRRRPEGIVLHPDILSLSLTHSSFPWACELIGEKEGEEGGAACLPRYLQQSWVTNAPSW